MSPEPSGYALNSRRVKSRTIFGMCGFSVELNSAFVHLGQKDYVENRAHDQDCPDQRT